MGGTSSPPHGGAQKGSGLSIEGEVYFFRMGLQSIPLRMPLDIAERFFRKNLMCLTALTRRLYTGCRFPERPSPRIWADLVLRLKGATEIARTGKAAAERHHLQFHISLCQ